MEQKKTLQELNFVDDFLFGRVMTDETVCKAVLEKILNVEIDRIEISQEQKTINLQYGNKGVRLDVYAKDGLGSIYNVDVQTSDEKDLPQRMRYYQSNIDGEMIQRGHKHKELKKSYVIFICTFDYFKAGRHIYTFENVCLEDGSIRLKDQAQKIVLNTKGTMADVDEEMLEFLHYIEESTAEVANAAQSSLVKTIHQQVRKVKADKRAEEAYMTLQEKYQEIREEGREEGIAIGQEQGIAIGQEKGRKKVASSMKRMGLPLEQIAEATGLSIAEIEALANGEGSY